MERSQRYAIIASLIKKMREKGSWCGETHVQKSTYFLQELFNVPLEFEFVLYKYGPYSFDFRDELNAMRSAFILDLQIDSQEYGVRFFVTDIGKKHLERFPKTLSKCENYLNFITEKFEGKGVYYLERLATALYVILEEKQCKTEKQRVHLLHEYKPHISLEQATSAIRETEQIIVTTKTM